MAFTSEDIVGSIIPRVYVSRITLQSTSDDKLLSNLQFVIKDRFANNNISSWIEQDPDLLKYISIGVVQSSNQEFTNQLETQINEFLNSGDPNTLQILNSLRPELDYKIFNPFVQGAPLNLQQMVEAGLAEKVETEPGIREYNIFFDINFNSGITENTDHLSYVFFSFYNTGAALESTSEMLSIQEINDDVLAGVAQVQMEKVISNGSVISTSHIYVDEQQNIWPGQVHTKTVNRDGRSVLVYRSGQFEDSQSVDLQRIEIQNNKVQDFRQLERIITLQRTDVAPLDEEFIGSFKPNQIEELFTKNNASISNLFHSIDRSKNISLTFALDYKQMFLNNSTYGRVLKNIIDLNTQNGTSTDYSAKVETAKNLLNTLYLMADIEQITFKCRRTDLEDSISSKKENEQIVFSASGKKRISQIEKNLIFANKPEQIRVFSASDKILKINGTYQYSVEIDYQDKTKQIISQIIELLKLEQRKFKTYYEYAILPNAFNQVTKRFRADAFSEMQTINSDIQTQLENFATNLEERRKKEFSLAENFFRSYSERASAATKNLLTQNRNNLLQTILDFPNSVTIYLSVLRKFFGIASVADISSTLKNWLNPFNATPESISYVVQVYDEMISSLESIILLTKSIDSSLNEKGENIPKESVQSETKVVSIKKTFSNKIDLDNSYMLEYLDNMAIDNTNTFAEVSKGYESLQVDLLNRKLNEFTKLSIVGREENIEEKTYDNLNTILGYSANVNVYDDLFYITNRQTGYNPAVEQVSQTTNNLQISYPIVQQSLLKQSRAQEARLESEDKILINDLLLKLLKPTISQNTENIKFIKSSIPSLHKNLFEKTNSVTARIETTVNTQNGSDVIVGSIVNLIERTSIPFDYVANVPNQIKSLFQLKIRNPQIAVNDAESRFKYEMLKKIEYLEGFQYDRVNDTYVMTSPVWKTLNNLSLFNENSDKLLFCRLRNYEDKTISYKFNSALSEKTINEHFLLNVRKYHENFSIVNGATNISFEMFDQRCRNELVKYFDGETEPSVNFVIANREIRSAGGYLSTLYSFLAPHGIQFDDLFKVFGTYLPPTIPASDTTPEQQDVTPILQFEFVPFELFSSDSNTAAGTETNRGQLPALADSNIIFSRIG